MSASLKTRSGVSDRKADNPKHGTGEKPGTYSRAGRRACRAAGAASEAGAHHG